MHASSSRAAKIQENYREVLRQVTSAAQATGRNPGDIRVVAVTKYVGIADAMALVDGGCLDLGESRPQSIWEKAAAAPATVRWHLIGHLQRNKVRRTLPQIHLLHSLDSMRLTEELAKEASSLDMSIGVLLEIQIAQDASKTGMAPEDAAAWLERYVADERFRNRVQLQGLMGMSSLGADVSQVRREFASLRTWMETWNQRYALAMTELSMGMSQDFEAAIAEGSTMLRIGSRLFEGLPDA
jgi:pyridoxal phosphate enzyme (YggS family)